MNQRRITFSRSGICYNDPSRGVFLNAGSGVVFTPSGVVASSPAGTVVQGAVLPPVESSGGFVPNRSSIKQMATPPAFPVFDSDYTERRHSMTSSLMMTSPGSTTFIQSSSPFVLSTPYGTMTNYRYPLPGTPYHPARKAGFPKPSAPTEEDITAPPGHSKASEAAASGGKSSSTGPSETRPGYSDQPPAYDDIYS